MKSVRLQIKIALGLVTLACRPAFAEEISGTYVGKGSNSAILLQIVETKDGHLTGRYEEVTLPAGGKIADMNAAVAGAVNGQTVVVTITPAGILSGNITASGTIEGRALHLAAGGNDANLTLNLLKSDEVDFRAQVAALTERARQISEARAIQDAIQRNTKIATDLLSGLRNITEKIRAFSIKADSLLPKFAPAEQRYKEITRWMRGALARERAIYGDGQASVARGQLSVAINQASIEGNQFHNSVQTSLQDAVSTADQLTNDAKKAGEFCKGPDEFTGAAATVVGPKAKGALCAEFLEAEKTFRQRVSDLSAAFARIEAVWKVESAVQNRIVNDADAAVQ